MVPRVQRANDGDVIAPVPCQIEQRARVDGVPEDLPGVEASARREARRRRSRGLACSVALWARAHQRRRGRRGPLATRCRRRRTSPSSECHARSGSSSVSLCAARVKGPFRRSSPPPSFRHRATLRAHTPSCAHALSTRAPAQTASSTSSMITRRSSGPCSRPRPPRSPGLFFGVQAAPPPPPAPAPCA